VGLAEWVAFGILFVVVTGLELWLLFNPAVSAGLAYEIGVSSAAFAILTWIAAVVILGAVYWAVEHNDDRF